MNPVFEPEDERFVAGTLLEQAGATMGFERVTPNGRREQSTANSPTSRRSRSKSTASVMR